jgi:hypothetical protein
MVDEEIGDRFYQHAGDIETKADDGEDINEADELVEEITAEDADSEDGEDNAQVFTEKGLYGENMIGEGLGGLKDGEDHEIDPEIAVQFGVFLLFQEPAAEEDDKGKDEHFDGLIEEGVGGVADQQKHR